MEFFTKIYLRNSASSRFLLQEYKRILHCSLGALLITDSRH